MGSGDDGISRANELPDEDQQMSSINPFQNNHTTGSRVPDRVATDATVPLRGGKNDNTSADTQTDFGSAGHDPKDGRRHKEVVQFNLVGTSPAGADILAHAHDRATEITEQARAESDAMLAAAKRTAFEVADEAHSRAAKVDSATANGIDVGRYESDHAPTEASRTRIKIGEDAKAARMDAQKLALDALARIEADSVTVLAAHESAMAEFRSSFERHAADLMEHLATLEAQASLLDERLIVSQTAVSVPAEVEEEVDASFYPPREDVEVAPAEKSAPSPSQESASEPPTAKSIFTDAILRQIESKDAARRSPGSESDPLPRSEDVGPVDDRNSQIAAETDRPKTSTAFTTHRPDTVASSTEVDVAAPTTETTARTDPSPQDRTDSPSPTIQADSSTSDENEVINRKESYYSRRSAKLPRLGVDAGRSAVSAANALRPPRKTPPADEERQGAARRR